MATKTIADYTAAVSIDATNDYLLIEPSGNTVYNKINRNTFLGLSSAPVGLTDSQTLTNKTLTSPTINGATLSGTLSGTYTIGGTPTFPSSVVTLTGTQTLTNKTLTSPTISAPTITNASITADTVAGFTSTNNGTFYGISVTSSKFSGTAISNTTLPYTALDNGSSWAWTTFTPSPAGYTGAVTVTIARYIQIGKNVFLEISFTGTSNATTCTFTLPAAPKNACSFHTTVTDSGTVQTSSGLISLAASSTTATCYKTLASGAFTNSGTKAVQVFNIVYEVA